MRIHALDRFSSSTAAGMLMLALALGPACHKKDEAGKAAGLAPSGAAPPAAPAAPASPAPAAGATLSGRITLSPARKGDVTPSDVVYLVARRMPDSPGTRGSLVAVKRFTAASFPIEFTMSQADMMFKNGAFEGALTLSARVDKDGDPITRRKGDVFGTVDGVKVGSSGVEIALSELQTEDESLAGAAPGGGMPSGHP